MVSPRALAALLPPHLLQRLATSGAPPLPHADRLPAALLLIDIAGFTALTERLQARGRAGAEEMTEVVREAFRPAIEAIEARGGSIATFGGDALFVVFTGEGRVGRARATATDVAGHFEAHEEVPTSAGPVRLRVSQAIHHGEVAALHLGRPDRRLHILAGPPTCALARLESRVAAGRIRLSRAAATALAREPATTAPPPQAPAPPVELFLPYVPPHLPPLVGHFEGEFRHAAMLFLESKGMRLAALQALVLLLWETLDAHGGILVGTDLSPVGTRWLCAFGAPVSHDDAADRAARAALALMARLPRGISARAGLHAGTVASIWMGAASRRSYELMGDVTNSAARALVQAPLGEILTTEGGRRLLTGVETAPRGSHAAKGKAEPLVLHAVTGVRARRRPAVPAVPMVGRDAELAAIRAALDEAAAGRGGTIAIEGAAGLGKSRLKWEAARIARTLGFQVHEGRAISSGGGAYWGIGDLLRDALEIPDGAPREVVQARVAEVGAALGMPEVDRHHIADVLGARPEDSGIGHLRPAEVRLNNTIAIRSLATRLSRESPRLLVFEDMHWADEMTREAADWLALESPALPLLCLLLHRPGYTPPAGSRRLLLAELDDGAMVAMLASLLGGAPARVKEAIRQRAEGNPFYVEEIVRHVKEAGVLVSLGPEEPGVEERYELARELREEDLPASVEAVIAERLDALPLEVKRVAQHAAVIGRSFLLELLERLGAVGAAARPSVGVLCARELTFPIAPEPRSEYTFKHALTRDVAYQGILVAGRRRIHREVADAIEQIHGPDCEPFLAMLAHHREQAGQAEEARRRYLAGARAAARRFAHEETERLLRGYLALAAGPTPESIAARNELAEELRIQGRTEDTERERRLALEEARLLGDRRLEASTLAELAAVWREQGRAGEARPAYEEVLAIHRELGDRMGEASGIGNLATLAAEAGDLEEAQRAFEESLALHRALGNRLGEAKGLGNLSNVLHDLGHTAEAITLGEKSVALAHEIGNPHLETILLSNLGVCHALEGHLEQAQRCYSEALDIARRIGGRRTEGIALGHLGNLLGMQGKHAEARVAFEQSLAIQRQVRGRLEESTMLGYLANLDYMDGRPESARELQRQALAISREIGHRQLLAIMLLCLARYDAFIEGPGPGPSALAQESVDILRAMGDRRELAAALVLQGHLALESGARDQAAARLAEARALAVETATARDSAMDREVAMLEKTLTACEGGAAMLLRGHLPGDLTEGQRRWLAEHGVGHTAPVPGGGGGAAVGRRRRGGGGPAGG